MAKIYNSPSKYVQGPDELANLGTSAFPEPVLGSAGFSADAAIPSQNQLREGFLPRDRFRERTGSRFMGPPLPGTGSGKGRPHQERLLLPPGSRKHPRTAAAQASITQWAK